MSIISEDAVIKDMLADLADLIDELSLPHTSISSIGFKFANRVYYKMRFSTNAKSITLEDYGKLIVGLVGDLGGNFVVSQCDDSSITFTTDSCIFGQHPSPTLCRVTSGVFGGLCMKYFGYGKVVLMHTIANGAKSCAIKVFAKRTRESDELIGLEFTKDIQSIRFNAKPDNAKISSGDSGAKDRFIRTYGSLLTANAKSNCLDDVIVDLRNSLANVPGVDMAFLFLKEESEAGYRLASYFGLSDTEKDSISSIEMLERMDGENSKQFVDRQLQHIANFGGNRVLLADAHGLNSFATLPLINRGWLIGALNVASRHVDPIRVEESAYLRDICNLLTIILENHELRKLLVSDLGTILQEIKWVSEKLKDYETDGGDRNSLFIKLILDKAGISDHRLKLLADDYSRSA